MFLAPIAGAQQQSAAGVVELVEQRAERVPGGGGGVVPAPQLGCLGAGAAELARLGEVVGRRGPRVAAARPEGVLGVEPVRIVEGVECIAGSRQGAGGGQDGGEVEYLVVVGVPRQGVGRVCHGLESPSICGVNCC